MNNEWIYIAPHSDTMTSLSDEKEPVVTVLEGVASCELTLGAKDLPLSVLLDANCTVMSDVTLKVGYLLTQNPTQSDRCEEFGLKVNIS